MSSGDLKKGITASALPRSTVLSGHMEHNYRSRKEDKENSFRFLHSQGLEFGKIKLTGVTLGHLQTKLLRSKSLTRAVSHSEAGR